MALKDEHAVHIEAGTTPLPKQEALELMQELPGWTLNDGSLTHTFTFKDFQEAMKFVDRVAEIANEQDHHPDIYISYNKVRLDLSTHRIGGLSRNDFIVAAKIGKC